MTEAYPLTWPDGWPRTPFEKRQDGRSKFVRHDRSNRGGSAYDWTFAAARDALMDELARHDARDLVLSTNRQLRRDGLPMSGGRGPDDDGIAIYFTRAGKPLAMACDRFHRAEHNMRSLALALEAMRALERHGGGVMMERAYAGFAALPPPGKSRTWREVLKMESFDAAQTDASMIEARYRALAKKAHPDAPGGSHDQMAELNRAKEEALREVTR